MSGDSRSSEQGFSRTSRRLSFEVEDVGYWEILVPHTVYPPREDTNLLARALKTIDVGPGLAVEIGCGSGAISIFLASLGWRVEACDVNPIAVAAARGNAQAAGLSEKISIGEGGVGETGWKLPEETGLVVWNLPYLDPVDDDEILEPIEDASMLDIPGGWSDELLKKIHGLNVSEDCIVVMLQRTDPPSQSKSDSWLKSGWACRTILSERIGVERLEVKCFWKPARGFGPVVLEECESTMDEAKSLNQALWGRVLALNQATGRGRRGSEWKAFEGGLACTWLLPYPENEMPKLGLLQTSIGAILSSSLGCYCKWPNDLIDEKGNKMGGVLVESSTSESAIRVGVGINRDSAVEDGLEVSGWSKYLPEMELMDVFALVDAILASVFESNPRIPSINESELLEISWKGLATLLSQGTCIQSDEKNLRVIGIDDEGRLEIEVSGRVEVTDDVGSVEWFIPSS